MPVNWDTQHPNRDHVGMRDILIQKLGHPTGGELHLAHVSMMIVSNEHCYQHLSAD